MTEGERDETRALVVQAVHDAMPEALAEALGPEIKRTVKRETTIAVREVLRRWAWRTAFGFLLLFLGLGYVVHENHAAIDDNQARSTASRTVLCRIITQGDASTYAYRHDGLLNEEQLQRALRQSASYRKQLGPAPACSPGITPPPMPQP